MNTYIAAALLGFFLGVVFTSIGFLTDAGAACPHTKKAPAHAANMDRRAPQNEAAFRLPPV